MTDPIRTHPAPPLAEPRRQWQPPTNPTHWLTSTHTITIDGHTTQSRHVTAAADDTAEQARQALTARKRATGVPHRTGPAGATGPAWMELDEAPPARPWTGTHRLEWTDTDPGAQDAANQIPEG